MSPKTRLLIPLAFLILNAAGLLRFLHLYEQSLMVETVLAEEPPSPPVPPQPTPVPLQLLSSQVQSFDPDGEMTFLLRFNQPVDGLQVGASLELRDTRGNILRPNLRETPVPGEIFVTTRTGTGAPLQMVLLPGPGFVRTRVTQTLNAPPAFSLLTLHATQPGFAPGWIDLTFTSPPDIPQIRPHISIEPSVSFSAGQGEWWNRNRVRLTGDFEPGTRYRVTLAAGLPGLNGAALQREGVQSLIFPEKLPGLQFTHGGTLLNASGSRQVQIETVNEGVVTAELHRIHDNNLLTWLIRDLGDDGWQAKHDPDRNLGTPLWEDKIPVENGLHALDLSEALALAGQGAFRLRVRGKNSGRQIDRVLLLGDLGLLARRQPDALLVWVCGLGDATPREGATVQAWSVTRQLLAEVRTDARGLAMLPLAPDGEEPLLLLVRRDHELGVLSLRNPRGFPGPGAARAYSAEANEAFVFTDRGMYRPGETVHLRAILRGREFRLPGSFPVRLTVTGPDGTVMRRETHRLSELGTFDSAVTLDAAWPNGPYRFSVALPAPDAPEWGGTVVHLESFVPPEVVVELESPPVPEHTDADFMLRVNARLLYGEPAANHPVESTLSVVPELFRSSENPLHSFSDVRKSGFARHTGTPVRHQTNAVGETAFPIRIPAHLQAPSALRATVNVTVIEFSGRAATAVYSRRIDPHPAYLGLRTRPVSNTEMDVDVVRVSPEDTLLEESAEVKVIWYRRVWTRGYRRDNAGRFTFVSETHEIPEGETLLTLEGGRGQVRIRPGAPGAWRVAVESADSSAAAVDVSLGEWTGPSDRADRVEISLDREAYAAGDTARVTLNSPFAGSALVTVESDRILSREVRGIPEGVSSMGLSVPDAGVANVWVRVAVLRPQPGPGGSPTLMAEGATALALDWRGFHRPLEMDVASEARPGRPLRMTLRGEPGAEVSVAGVDEGILMLNGFETPDPFAFFAARRRNGILQWDLFSLLLPELGLRLRDGDPEMGGDMAGLLRNRMNPIDANRFRPLAWNSGAFTLPESGEAVLEIQLPEFTGEVRWMAVQAARNGVGSAEARTRFAREVVTQQSLPLFLAPGDWSAWRHRFHNRSSERKELRLRFSSEGPAVTRNQEDVVTLEPGEILFYGLDISARDDAGVSRFRVDYELDGERWREEHELAVRPEQAYRSETVIRLLEPGASLRLEPMTGVYPQTVRRELRVSALPTLELTGAVDYLIRYPYGCLEQTVSGGYALLRVPELHDGARDMAQAAVHRIAAMQRRDGSFTYWTGSDTLAVEAGLYAIEFWLDARAEGLEIDARRLRSALEWARNVLNRGAWSTTQPQENLNRVHAALVLAKAGQLDRGWAQRIRERREDFDTATRVFAAEMLVELGERPAATEMLSGIEHIRANGWSWYSDLGFNAHLLRVLCRIGPGDSRIPRLVKTLHEQRVDGRWGQTYENAASVRAVAAYRDLFAKTGGDVSVRLNGADTLEEGVMITLEEGAAPELKNFSETPVYISELRGGVPRVAPEIRNAFGLSVVLLDLNGRLPRHENDRFDTPWIRSGSHVLMKVTLDALPGPVSHLVVDLRLPAGLEPMPLRTQRRLHELAQIQIARNQLRDVHVEIRDDRILLFPPVLRERKVEYYLLLRSVTPGLYHFPAAYAQSMYDEAFEALGTRFQVEVAE